MNILSVGCGDTSPQLNLIRLDKSEKLHPDVIWDLDKFPYPFRDSIFGEIHCFDVIEHLNDIPQTLEEFHRILKPGGLVKITTPHFSCANSFIDPTHKYHLSYFSLDFFCESHKLSYYSTARYRIKHRYIHFQQTTWFNRLTCRLANRFPFTYEQRYAWLLPAWYLEFELESIK